MAGKVTVRDVARAANVSASTVSRALSASDLVAPDTRRHIQQVAERLGYTPPGTDPEITAWSRQLAIVVPDIEHPSYASLIKGACHQALRENFFLSVADSGGDPAVELRIAHQLSGVTAGVILCSSRIRDDEIQQLSRETPLVLVNRSAEGVATAGFDWMGPIRRALEHLYSLGHRTVAYAGGPETSLSDARRREAIEAVQPTLPGLEVTSLGHFEPELGEGRFAADLLVATSATAVLAFNDFIAVQIMARLRTRGLKVPEDVSVVGIDDMPSAAVAQPALTTVKTPVREVGRSAVNRLLDQVEPLGTPRPQITMAVALVVRESTAVAEARALTHA